ncbi:MAG: MFS transporter [Proteobacteria bacterium]|nr:MFS transporter [Pseudomonadota bacterium]
MSDNNAPSTSQKPASTENPLAVILFNIAIPAIILYRFSKPNYLGPMGALAVALAFPLGFGLYDFAMRRKANPISLLGFVSIFATGSFGVFHLDGSWYAVKEAVIPTMMGVAVLFSLRTKSPLVRTMLYNDRIIDVAKVDEELAARSNTDAFNVLLVRVTWLLAASFLLSAVLNFTLATYIVKSPAGTPEFNQELGRMTAVSYPSVVIPCMLVTMGALFWLLSGIKKLTGLDLDTIFKSPPPKAKKGDV